MLYLALVLFRTFGVLPICPPTLQAIMPLCPPSWLFSHPSPSIGHSFSEQDPVSGTPRYQGPGGYGCRPRWPVSS